MAGQYGSGAPKGHKSASGVPTGLRTAPVFLESSEANLEKLSATERRVGAIREQNCELPLCSFQRLSQPRLQRAVRL